MPDNITRCVEEEYSFCVSCLWRRQRGWRVLLMYFRGPGSIPFFIVPLLSLLGWWRFARSPHRLADYDFSAFSGSVVTRTSAGLGSYGMGGPGFVGICVRDSSGRSIWIVFTIWAAAGWLTLDGALLEEANFPEARGDTGKTFRPLTALVGARVASIRLVADLVELFFSQRGSPRVLRLQRDSSHLPVHGGSREPKVFLPTEDLRDAVIVSRDGNLWLND